MKKTLITVVALGGIAMGADALQSWDLLVYQDANTKVDEITGGNGNFFFDVAGAELSSYMFDFTLTKMTTTAGDTTLFGTERVSGGAGGLTFLTWQAAYVGVGDAKTHNGENGGNSIALSQGDNFRFAYDAVSSTAYLYNVTKDQLAIRNLSSDNASYHLVSGTSNNNLGASAVFTNGGNDYASYGTVYDMSSLAGNDTVFSTYVKTMVVPEPTTATLSLLALAGLAARRRR